MFKILSGVFVCCIVGLLNGCAQSTTGNDETTWVGRLVDAPVEGVTYRCGEKVSTTDKEGGFSCRSVPVVFSIGGVRLGSIGHVMADGLVFPQDLVGVSRDTTDETSIKIARLLQSLDDDGDIEQGIRIAPEIAAKFPREDVSVETLSHEALTQMLAAAGAVRIVTAQEAEAHLERQMMLHQEMILLEPMARPET